MSQFSDWCLKEGEKKLLSRDQLVRLAKRMAEEGKLNLNDLEEILKQFGINPMSESLMESEQYQEMLRKAAEGQDGQVREKIAETLERKLDSSIDYDSAQKQEQEFESFKREMEEQAEKAIESEKEGASRAQKDFRAGDKIRMNAGASRAYRWTKEGSKGVVVEDEGSGRYRVRFSKQTGAPQRGVEEWQVEAEYMEGASLKERAKTTGGSKNFAKKLVLESIAEVANEVAREQIEQIREQKKGEFRERVLGELKGSKLFRGGKDGDYEVNQLELMEILGRKAYEEAMEMASFKKKPAKQGRHRSKVEQDSGVSARYKKTDRVSSGLAVLPTLRNSLIRRKTGRGESILHEDDLVAFDSEKKVSYAVEFLVDANKCITKSVSGTKQAALALYYMMKKFYPGDRYEFIKFNDDAKVIKLDELLTMQLAGCRDQGKAVDLGIERLGRQTGKQKVMYLITDGNPCGWGKGDERSSNLLEKAKELKKKDIQLVILAMCDRDSRFYGYSEEVAKAAGGLVYHVEDPTKLAQYTIESFRDLRRRK